MGWFICFIIFLLSSFSCFFFLLAVICFQFLVYFLFSHVVVALSIGTRFRRSRTANWRAWKAGLTMFMFSLGSCSAPPVSVSIEIVFLNDWLMRLVTCRFVHFGPKRRNKKTTSAHKRQRWLQRNKSLQICGAKNCAWNSRCKQPAYNSRNSKLRWRIPIRRLVKSNVFLRRNNYCCGKLTEMFFLARINLLQEHQQQVDEALMAYDEALETGDPSQLGDNVLRPISSVASDSDILSSPNSDRNKVNGGAPHFNVMHPLFIVQEKCNIDLVS